MVSATPKCRYRRRPQRDVESCVRGRAPPTRDCTPASRQVRRHSIAVRRHDRVSHFLAYIRKKSLRHPGCFSDSNEKGGSMKKALSICGLLAVVALPAEGGRPLRACVTIK